MRRRHAAPALVLPLAVAALAVGPVLAAGAGSGMLITPPVLEHAAVPGPVGSVTVTNSTGQAMNISVAAHPWVQSASGAAVPNQRVTLTTVRPSVGSFTLANGASRSVSVSLLRAPASGSLYGNVDVTAIPTQKPTGRNAVTVEYRLVQSLRLDPRHPVFKARARGGVVVGNHSRGELALAVTNTGNTVVPFGGSVHVQGARGAVSGAISPFRILPGATVNLPLLALQGSLPAGSYGVSATLTQSGHRVLSVSKRFTLR